MGYACKLASNSQVHTDTYTVTDDGNYDMGLMHKYRYANLKKNHSTTYSATDDGTYDMGLNHSYRYANLKKNHTATYTVSSNGTVDMGINHNYRYVSAGSRITTLGGTVSARSAQTYNPTGVPGRRSLNLNNFKAQIISIGWDAIQDDTTNGPIPTSYNASNGILSCNRCVFRNIYHGWESFVHYTIYVTY